jgi:hypothetical protein
MEVKMKTVKSLVLCCVLLCGVAVLGARGPHWLWARGAGGTGNDEGFSIAIDSQGNQYVTGTFESTVSFGSHILTSNGNYDIFVAKLDPDGNWLWVVQAGGTGPDWGGGVAVDGAGNAYVTGSYRGTVSFGSYTLTAYVNYNDMFVAKLNTNGTWLWAVSAGGGFYDQGNKIAVDGWGNAYMAVQSDSETITFGSCTLTRFGPGTDIYVAKLDPYGNWLWAVQAGGTADDIGNDIAVDGEGNPWVTGKFRGTATFGSQTLTVSGHNDVFVAKLNTNGNWLWAVQAGGTADDIGHGIALDGSGNAWVTGIFCLAASFGSHTLTTNSGGDIFVAKLDPSGNWLWAAQAGGTVGDRGYGIALDGSGNAYVTGYFNRTASFGSHSLSVSGYDSDIFVAKLDPSGNWLWAVRAGGTKPDEGYCIALDGSGIAYVTGYYRETGATFGSHSLPPNGSRNIFVAKLGMHPGAGIPIAPQNLSITRNGTHIFLDWGDVAFDLAGNPVSVDHYRVYYCASGPAGPFTVFGGDGSITQSQWTHSNAASQSPGFYYVTAVIAD